MRLRPALLLLGCFLVVAGCSSSSGSSVTVGSIRVSASTTKAQQTSVLDPNGYMVTVDAGGAQQLPDSGGLVVFGGLTLTSHTVSLSDLANNCALSAGTLDVVKTLDTNFPNQAVGYTVVCQ
jgi:hypothetical protein